MKKIKIADAPSIAIDWLVAKAEGWKPVLAVFIETHRYKTEGPFLYCTDPSEAWPIILREGITVGPWDTSPFMAHYGTHKQITSNNPRIVGKEALAVAMRCYCTRMYGDEAEVPEELLDA